MTPIRVPAQVVYRTKKGCLCDGIEGPEEAVEKAAEADAQVGYRLQAEVPEEPLRWIGSGLAAVGLTDRAAFAEGDEDRAMALMDWRDPRTGQRLMQPRVVMDPRSKLSSAVLLQALDALAEARGTTTEDVLASNQKSLAALTRLRNCVRKDGEAHVSSVKLLEKVAATAKLDLADLYPAEDLAQANLYRDRHVVNALRGNDLVLDATKSLSALYAMGDPQLAQAVMDIVQEAGRDAFAALEPLLAYGMRGEHGGGHSAERVAADGLLAWVMTHVSARPVEGEVGDPHLHLHISIAHMARGSADGQWSAPAAGGNDLMRHAILADRIFKARIRALTTERLGARWEPSERTDEWELVGVDQEMRDVLSRRHQQIAEQFGGSLEGVSRDQQKATARQTAQAKTAVTETSGDARADWRARFQAGGFDPDRMVADVLGGGPDGAGPTSGGPRMPSPEEIAAHVFRTDVGLDAHSKTFHHAQLLAAIAHALPGGMATGFGVPQLEDLAAEVLALQGVVVRLPDLGATHLSNPQRYTTGAVLEAERYLVEHATARLSIGAVQLPDATVEAAIGVFEASRGYQISAEQRASVLRLLAAGHGIDTLEGVAGSGKTTVMSVVRIALEGSGLVVAGAATAAVAAANLEADSGIPARTVAAWVRRIEQGEGLTGVDALVVEEAAMVDDRQLRTLVAEAERTGTKIIAIGDPQQLRAVGVGGAFARIHELLGGLTLRENRRQRDAGDRAALQDWRDGARRTALAALAERGRVHATEFPEQALAGILGAWDQARTAWSDPHQRTEQLLVLAARNADVEALNSGARAIRRAAGELGPDSVYRLAGGGSLRLAVGDAVRVRANDYRSRRGGSDILNGRRAQVTAIGPGRQVTITWQRNTADGPVAVSETLTTKQIAGGIVSHGYALTIAAAQGLTAETALVYGVGADAYSLYPALTRARGQSHLWLPSSLIEDQDTRTRLGEPRSERERLDRTLSAYATRLERDRPDGMVMDEIDGPPRREPPAVPPQTGGERARQVPDPDGDYLLAPPLQLVPAGPVPVLEEGDGSEGGTQRQRAADQQAAARRAEQHQVQQQRDAQEQADVLAAAALTAVPDTEAPAGEPVPDQRTAAALRELHQRDQAARTREQQLAVVPELDDIAAPGAAAPGAPVPTTRAPNWREREYGHVATRQLPDIIDKTEAQRLETERKAYAARTAARDLADVIGTANGPAERAAEQYLAVYDEIHARRAAAAQKDAKAKEIDASITGMYEQNRSNMADERRLRDKAQKKGVKLSLRGIGMRKTADELRDVVTARTEHISTLAKQSRDLSADASDDRKAADALVKSAKVRPDEPRLEALERVRRTGHAKDLAQLAKLQAEADQQTALAGRFRVVVVGLRSEATVREGFSPERESTETQARKDQAAINKRDQAARKAAQQAAAQSARASSRSYQDPYRFDGPSQGSGGISR